VVADVVNNLQKRLSWCSTQPPPELLHPDHCRIGGAQHEDGINIGDIDTFVEHVDRKDDVNLAIGEMLKRSGSWGASGTGMHGN